MGGKYEIRYYDYENECDIGYIDIYTNSWFEFMKLRLTKKVIYYKVYCE